MYKNQQKQQQQQQKPQLEHPAGIAGLRAVLASTPPPSNQMDPPPRYSAVMKVVFTPTFCQGYLIRVNHDLLE